jgi:DNA-directed RNA polymerase subunit M/transcription elongation factor TFIIS
MANIANRRADARPGRPSVQITCKRCNALADLRTVIGRFGDQPATQVFVCDVCDFVDVVPIK